MDITKKNVSTHWRGHGTLSYDKLRQEETMVFLDTLRYFSTAPFRTRTRTILVHKLEESGPPLRRADRLFGTSHTL